MLTAPQLIFKALAAGIKISLAALGKGGCIYGIKILVLSFAIVFVIMQI